MALGLLLKARQKTSRTCFRGAAINFGLAAHNNFNRHRVCLARPAHRFRREREAVRVDTRSFWFGTLRFSTDHIFTN